MKKIFIVLMLVLISVTSFSQNDAKRIAQYNLESKLAIEGYDPVAYFKQNKAVKGKNDFGK